MKYSLRFSRVKPKPELVSVSYLFLSPAFMKGWTCPFFLPVDVGYETKQEEGKFSGKEGVRDQTDGK